MRSAPSGSPGRTARKATATADPRVALELDAVAALVTLWSARPADALAMAEHVLARNPPRVPRVRAAIARCGALTLVGRRRDAAAAAAELLELVAEPGTPPYAIALAHSMVAMGWIVDSDTQAPSTHASYGRWPVMNSAAQPHEADLIVWPLAKGARLLFAGDHPAAVAHLREAVADQRLGEGLFRSEAITMLIVGLAATGNVDEAEQLLADEPPDAVALYPGLLLWARATVAAARGRPDAAELALAAAAQAIEAGALVSAAAYLAVAARLGAADRAARVLNELGVDFEPPRAAARAAAIQARARGDGKELLKASEQHAAVGFFGDALELAKLASAALSRDSTEASGRATVLVQQMRSRLQLPTPSFEPIVGLTRRELEVARLAGPGMADRDVAEALFLSVRTVESHLASAYRKLGISSRRQLRNVLAEIA